MLGRQVVALGDGFADKMQAAIVSALAAPEVAEKVLASIKPLFHSGDVVQLTALDPEGGPPNIVCADLSSEKGNGELIAFIQAYMRAQDWTCHAFVPLRLLTYAAFASKAKGLFQPSAECLRRGL